MTTEILLSCIGVVLGVAAVIFLSYKGLPALLSAVVGSIIMLLLSGMDIQAGILNDYAAGFSTQIKSILMMYYGCCLFASVMNSTYSTHAVAEWIASHFNVKHAPTALILVGLVLRLGGLNAGAYLIMFDLGIVLLSKANYSEDIMMAVIVGSCWTFVCSSPFFPSAHNSLIINAWGTTSAAGLIPGLVSAVFQIVATCLVLEFLVRRWAKKGHGFSAWEHVTKDEEQKKQYPNLIVALLPLVCVMFTFNVLHWTLAISLAFSALVCTVLNFKKFTVQGWAEKWGQGFKNAIPITMAIAAMTGMGGVVKTTPFFTYVFEVISTSTLNPYILLFASGAVLTFAIGSAGSAITLSLETITPFVQGWLGQGFDLGNMHRILATGAISVSALPTNGAVGALCEICHTTVKKSYGAAFIVGIIVPLVGGLCITLPLAMLGLK